MPVRLSIVTPSYNQGPYLEETLRSITAQRDRIHEFFVFDGGSTDDSVEIIRKYADRIDHWVSEPDDGQSDAIRRGFDMATGDVLYWLNSDDVLLPRALERVQEAFDARPDLQVVTGYGVAIDADSRIIEMRRRVHDSPGWARFGYLRVHQPSCFFRRDVYAAVGGIDEDLHCCLDTDLWLKFFRRDAVWGGIDHFLAAFRLHPEMKGRSLGEQYRRERRMMRERYPDMCAVSLPRHTMGRLGYLFSQVTTGRLFASLRDRRLRGRPLDEVFGNGKSKIENRKSK